MEQPYSVSDLVASLEYVLVMRVRFPKRLLGLVEPDQFGDTIKRYVPGFGKVVLSVVTDGSMQEDCRMTVLTAGGGILNHHNTPKPKQAALNNVMAGFTQTLLPQALRQIVADAVGDSKS